MPIPNKPKPPDPLPQEDQILKELVLIYDQLAFEDNILPDDASQHLRMLDLCNDLIEMRYKYVFEHDDPIGSVNYKRVLG